MAVARSRRRFDPLFVAAAAVLAAGVAVAVLLAVTGWHALRPRALPLLALPLAAGAAALYGWWRASAAAAALAERDERAQERLAAERQVHERDVKAVEDDLETRLRDREQALQRERELRASLEQSHRIERQWNDELRNKIVALQRDRGPLSEIHDVRQLVLRIAIELLDAEKGLLLAREDKDHDGDLDLVATQGFEHDPEHSGVVQHFAKQVLRRDETVRVDDPPPPERTAPADDEIRNLVAIPIYIADEFSGVVVCANKEGGFHDHDDEVLLALGDHAGAILQNARLQGDLRSSYLATIRMLGEAIEANDPFLAGHSEDVSALVAGVATALDIEPSRREPLIFGSLLHDVGKIGISERILLKPGALTPEERSVVELHPRIGYHLVQQVPALRQMADAILHHHERYDGEGYPSRLRGAEIPIEARIICVVDSFSAMTSKRPYRDPMTLEDACRELERCAGEQFDPEIVRLFVDQVRRRSENGDGRAAGAAATLAADPELQVRRPGEEPVIGFGAFALVDNLTLLYSRRYLHELARTEAQRAGVQERPFAVVLASLTDLDRINRDEGYAAGDNAIRALARAAENAAAGVGGTACRCSGRRLAIVVPAADEAAGEAVARELESELAGGLRVATVVAAWQPGDSGDDVIDRARQRLAAVA